MGACYNRDAAPSTGDSGGYGTSSGSSAFSIALAKRQQAERLRAKDHHAEAGWYSDDVAGSWVWKPVLQVPRGPEDRRESTDDSMDPSTYGGFNVAEWLEMAENGELDIYTCLGLSDANNVDADTRKLLTKIA